MLDEEFADFAAGIRPALRRRAYALCRDWHEADDLAQIVLIKLYRRWDRLDRREKLGGYLHTMLVRALLDTRRGAARSREVLAEDLPEPAPQPTHQEQVVDRLVLQDALAQLADRQRAAVLLRYVGRLSAEETAATLGCSPTTVRSQSCRGLASLRGLLAGAGTAQPTGRDRVRRAAGPNAVCHAAFSPGRCV